MNPEEARRDDASGPSAEQGPGGETRDGANEGSHGPGCCARMTPGEGEPKKGGGLPGWLCGKMMKKAQAHCFGK